MYSKKETIKSKLDNSIKHFEGVVHITVSAIAYDFNKKEHLSKIAFVFRLNLLNFVLGNGKNSYIYI